MTYDKIPPEMIKPSIDELIKHIDYAFGKHGNQSYASAHEGYGVTAEEMAELLDAIRANNSNEIGKEALDVAVSAFWLYVSAKYGRMNER